MPLEWKYSNWNLRLHAYHSFVNDLMIWKRSQSYWPFARGIHRSPSTSQRTSCGVLMFHLLLACFTSPQCISVYHLKCATHHYFQCPLSTGIAYVYLCPGVNRIWNIIVNEIQIWYWCGLCFTPYNKRQKYSLLQWYDVTGITGSAIVDKCISWSSLIHRLICYSMEWR